ncbi:MAG TPA: hypothetical protein ENN67_06730 [Firmicutes bacterium]|nr:hypothetical protein [Bacillota bacterium]
MSSRHGPEQLVFDKRRRALIDSLLDELLKISGCRCAVYADFNHSSESIVTQIKSDSIPEIDCHSIIKLLYESQGRKPEFTVITRDIVNLSPKLGAMVDVFERGFCDIAITLPLIEDGVLLGVAGLFGNIPPVDPDSIVNELKYRLEGIAIMGASALSYIIHSNNSSSETDLHPDITGKFPIPMLLADHNGTVLESNPAFNEIFGFETDSLNGLLIHREPLLGQVTRFHIETLLETGEPFNSIEHLGGEVTESGDELLEARYALTGRYFRFRGYPYTFSLNSPSGIVLLADDVTDEFIASKKAELREKRHAREIELAKNLQKDFFPEIYQRKRIRIVTRLIAAEELAGDFFDVLDLGPNAIGVVIGDVVGRGVPGSLMAMSVHGMIANQAGSLTPPMKVLERVNDALYHQVKGDYWYATCFYAKIHTSQLRFTYSRAGHELPLWFDSTTGEVKPLSGDGMPLGIFPDAKYTTHQIHLNEGDRLLLFTDGLTDAANMAGGRFGHDRLIELFRKNCTLSPKNLVRLIEKTVRDFRGAREQLDDIAIVLITIVPDSWTTVTIPPFSFHEIAENLLRDLDMKGTDEDTQFKIRLSLDECVTNAFRHGHRCDERMPITVSYMVESEKVTMKVRDNGYGFDFGLIPDPTLEENLMQPGGRGVFLTLKLMDEVTFNDVGNEITLVKYLHVPRKGRRKSNFPE